MTGQPRLSIIPGWCSMDPRLKGKDLQVLCVLGRNTSTKSGWCRRSQVKIAEGLGCARSTVQASLERLIEIGAVERREVKSASGRDSAYFYRVIYDREPPGGYALDADHDDEEEDNFPPFADDEATPPAGIPAPPAGPGSAPPAGPGSAPINASRLTPPAEREREEAREREEGDSDSTVADPAKIVRERRAVTRAFERWLRTWPVKDSAHDTALDAWMAMTAEQQADCIELTPAYIAHCGGEKKITTWAAVYLRERRWEMLPARRSAQPSHELVAAFGKGGMAARLWTLCQPEAAHPRPPATVERIIAEGGERADDEIINRRALYSWPRLVEMNRRIAERKPDEEAGLRVAPEIARLGADFVSTDLAGPVGQAWKRLFRRMKLPFLPSRPGQPDWPKYVYLPPVGEVDAGELDKAVAAAWWRWRERVTGNGEGARDADAA